VGQGRCRRRSVERRPPELEDLLDVSANMVASLQALDASHQQLVVVGLAVTHRRHHRAGNGLRVKRAGRGGPPDAAAAPVTGVPCDLLGSLPRAAGEEAPDLACELALELEVFA